MINPKKKNLVCITSVQVNIIEKGTILKEDNAIIVPD